MAGVPEPRSGGREFASRPPPHAGTCQSPQSGPVCCTEDRLSTRTVDSSSKERMKDELRGVA